VPLAASVTFAGPGDAKPNSVTVAKHKRLGVTVLSNAVRGPNFLVKLHAPAGGRIALSGTAITPISRTIKIAGTYNVKVSLTSVERKALARRGAIRVIMRVAYRSADGNGSTAASVRLTVRRTPPRRRGRTGREATTTRRATR
jgi:hypothetical protein